VESVITMAWRAHQVGRDGKSLPRPGLQHRPVERPRRLDLNELDRVAKALRLDRVMRPYLEMLVA
jgi:hypothetical protein